MRALRLLGRIFLFLASTSASVHSAHGAVISSCDQAGLETAVASGGNFAFACDATITLTSTLNISNHLVLDGTGHNIVINGNNAVRLFQVAPGAYLELVNLSLVNGRYVGTKGVNGANGTQAQPGESANGGAILVQNGNVLLTSCILSNNSVLGGVGGSYSGPDMLGAKSGGAGNGGAICVINGELSATGCVFARNWAMGATGGNTFKDLSFAPPGSSYGGAVCNVGGNLKLTNNVFVSNLSTGSLAVLNTFNYGPAGAAYGGAIHSEGGQASLIGSSFVSNVAGGGFVAVNGGSVGNGNGGGLSVTNGAILVRLCSFEKNRALGGNAGRFAGVGKGFGGAIFNQGTIDVSDTTLSGNSAITGRSANAGFESAGGGVYNAGRGTFNRCLLVENLTLGGLANSIQGGGGNGGDGLGGGIYNLSMLLMTNSTLMKNVAQGQNGTFNMYNVRGQGGAGKGGALCNAGGEAVLMNVTIVTNKILNGIGITNGAGAGGGIYSTNGTVTLLNTIVAHSPSGSNCFGVLTDGGYNLSSDSSCNFTNTGSLNDIDPLLGPLQDNGGATLTTALTDCSPALDAGSPTLFPPIDQRGVTRPIASRSDIGACEGIVTWYHTLVSFPNNGVELRMFGKPNQTVTINTSPDMANWTPAFTNHLGPDCSYLFNTTKAPQAFFKIVYQ